MLCAPISYMEGSRAAAVIQLVNKSLPMRFGADDANANPTGIAHFSNDDEELLCELAEHLSASLRVKYANGSLAVRDDLLSERMEFSQTYNRVARKLSVANRGEQYGGRKSQNLQMNRRTIKRLITRRSSMVMLQSISRHSHDLTQLDDIATAAVTAVENDSTTDNTKALKKHRHRQTKAVEKVDASLRIRILNAENVQLPVEPVSSTAAFSRMTMLSTDTRKHLSVTVEIYHGGPFRSCFCHCCCCCFCRC